MVTIKVLDHVERCYSNQDGAKIQHIILSHFTTGEKISVSFDGVDGVTSSFINTALIELLDHYDFSVIKTNLKFVKSNKQINEMIRSRFKFEVNRRKQLVAI